VTIRIPARRFHAHPLVQQHVIRAILTDDEIAGLVVALVPVVMVNFSARR